MNRIYSHLDEVNLIAKLADLKEEHCKNTIVLSALIELLIDKGWITSKEIELKASEIDMAISDSIHPIP